MKDEIFSIDPNFGCITVAELIERLQQCDPAKPVVVNDGYRLVGATSVLQHGNCVEVY
jgi:hypothetical protein|nr:MAG TPA: Guanosine-3',5'-bis(Diphosphate) 3'-pyrophosphohydrolase development, TGS domain, predominantly [Caudoviricetes sp.]